MPPKRRVAIMIELQGAWQRHLEILRGVLKYADEHDNWNCVIDEFVPQSLPKR